MKIKEEKSDRTWHSNFIDYTEMMVKHPNYNGLYFERGANNRVKWVVTGKSSEGQKRRKWWDEQCIKHGIEIKAGCYAKIAVLLHPTKKHVCQICGRELSVEYVYPNKNSLKALQKSLGIVIEPFTLSIYDIVEKYGATDDRLNAIKAAFKIESCIENKSTLADYMFKHCSSRLSPGVMSNSPDRFDGFHSDGNCCRGISDKGRHKNNLQRYSQDRRAYENWADGNWKMAERLMAEFDRNGVSADHIGPISLGFCHRAKFQPMTKSENSAKNNRMSLNDVNKLLADETNGEQVISWHSKYLWDKLKNKVTTEKEAVKLSTLMRNNLHQILLTFAIISENGYNDFLTKLLHPDYSFYDYAFVGFNPKTGEYKEAKQKKLIGKNQQNNANRYIRIALESLEKYKEKDNRRQYAWDSEEIDKRVNTVLSLLKEHKEKEALANLKKTFQQLAYISAKKW